MRLHGRSNGTRMANSFVYGLRCADGPFVYVGSTHCTLKQRLKAHFGKALSLRRSPDSVDYKPLYSWLLGVPDRTLLCIEPLCEIINDDFQRRWAAERAMIANVSCESLIRHKIVICNVFDNPFRTHLRGRNSIVNRDAVREAYKSIDIDLVVTAESLVIADDSRRHVVEAAQ